MRISNFSFYSPFYFLGSNLMRDFADLKVDKVDDMMADMGIDEVDIMVADMEGDEVADMVADIEGDEVADMLANMKVDMAVEEMADMLANMEVDMMAGMKVNKVADIFSFCSTLVKGVGNNWVQIFRPEAIHLAGASSKLCELILKY